MNIDVISPNNLMWGNKPYLCVLGQGGVKFDKREGDGASPIGHWPLVSVFYRPDRITRPNTGLPVRALRPSDGWCDDPSHASYNQHIQRPFPASHEPLWRNDDVYNLIVILDYNNYPVVPGRGSAIFIHIARPDYAPTQGCVALKLEDLSAILIECGSETDLVIHPTPQTAAFPQK